MQSFPSIPPAEAMNPNVLAAAHAASLGATGRSALSKALHLQLSQFVELLPAESPSRLFDALSWLRHEIDEWLDTHPKLFEDPS